MKYVYFSLKHGVKVVGYLGLRGLREFFFNYFDKVIIFMKKNVRNKNYKVLLVLFFGSVCSV